MRQIHVRAFIAEPKLQHGDSRNLQPSPQRMNLRSDVAQIFRKERQSPKRLAQFSKQIVPRTIHPAPVNRRRLRPPESPRTGRTRESDPVGRSRNSASPSASAESTTVPLRLHHVPAIKRIPPALPSLAEKIRRHARHHLRLQILLQPEKFAMHPDVGAVVIHENGNVAHNANRALRAIPPQRLPLLIKSKLQSAADLQVVRQLLARLLQRARFALRQPCRPFVPARQFLLRTQRIEQNEIVQPPRVLRTKAF